MYDRLHVKAPSFFSPSPPLRPALFLPLLPSPASAAQWCGRNPPDPPPPARTKVQYLLFPHGFALTASPVPFLSVNSSTSRIYDSEQSFPLFHLRGPSAQPPNPSPLDDPQPSLSRLPALFPLSLPLPGNPPLPVLNILHRRGSSIHVLRFHGPLPFKPMFPRTLLTQWQFPFPPSSLYVLTSTQVTRRSG